MRGVCFKKRLFYRRSTKAYKDISTLEMMVKTAQRDKCEKLAAPPDVSIEYSHAMKTNQKSKKNIRAAKRLAKALGDSKQVKNLIAESAEDLSNVNTVLNQELANQGSSPEVEEALEKNEAIEDRVQEASEKLSVVNQALENEVEERHVLEHQLAVSQQQEEAARHAAFHDPLTGLPNRLLFDDRLEHGLEQAKRHSRTLAVLFVDLDQFKAINDTHGHDVGDGVLKMIAERLKENMRGDDTVSRHGGDEFLYLLMEIGDEADIKLLVEKIISAVQVPCDMSVGTGSLSLSVKASIGIALFPKDGATAEMLIQSADKAMYRAKRENSGYAFAS